MEGDFFAERGMPWFPVHMIGHLRLTGAELTVAFLNHEWLETRLNENSVAIEHEACLFDSKEWILLTAKGERLRAFLTEHVGTKDAFDEGGLVFSRNGAAR